MRNINTKHNNIHIHKLSSLEIAKMMRDGEVDKLSIAYDTLQIQSISNDTYSIHCKYSKYDQIIRFAPETKP